MNLLMIVERFPPDLGGLARSAERIAGALGQAGVGVHVLAWTKTLPSGRSRPGHGPRAKVRSRSTGSGCSRAWTCHSSRR